jgi:L-aspartate oxidase
MLGRHPLAELAPRDVVAKAIMRRMAETGEPHMWLDARTGVAAFDSEFWQARFPTIWESCQAHGIDPSKDLIPVALAEHFASGGVRTDVWGRTSVPRLYACGETACTGVHGANRLASNSLPEGLVFAERIGVELAKRLPWTADVVPVEPEAEGDVEHMLLDPAATVAVQHAMTLGAGVLRSAASLEQAIGELAAIGLQTSDTPHVEAWEATNLHLLATAFAQAAALRTETRGSHWRQDFAVSADEWRARLVTRIDPATNELITEPQPLCAEGEA